MFVVYFVCAKIKFFFHIEFVTYDPKRLQFYYHFKINYDVK